MRRVSRPLIIDVIKDLPARTRPLNGDELENVFGGCRHHLESCTSGIDCCFFRCDPSSTHAGKVCISKWL
jgi:hypothetical protein